MDTREAVEEMIGGSTEALEKLIEIYYPKALRLAYLISGNFADSQDIAQEAFTACYFNRKKIKQPQFFDKYLYKTVSRTAWKICRKHNIEQPVEYIADENTADTFSLSEEFIKKQEQKELLKAIGTLPIKQRTAVILFYFNGFSSKEIAHITGSFEGTVKSRLFSARQKLKTLLENSQNFRKEGGTEK